MNFMIFRPRGCFLFFKISFISPYSFRKSKNLKIFLPLDMLSSMDFARTTERIFFCLNSSGVSGGGKGRLPDKWGKFLGVLHASDKEVGCVLEELAELIPTLASVHEIIEATSVFGKSANVLLRLLIEDVFIDVVN